VLRLLTLGLGAAGLVALDYYRSLQTASASEGAAEMTFRTYLDGIPARIASVTGSSGTTAGLTGTLADMLPRAPEGWTVRPATADDIDVFLPKSSGDGDPVARDLVKSIASTRVSKGAEVVILTYEKGERRVMVQAVRFPDRIFTDDTALEERFDLQMQSARQPGRPFMTVRGLDVTEDFLGDGMRARYLVADVGAQIRIRVLASKRLKDADLVAFLETLNVKAMNADVVDRQAGLGDLPVIALASAMTDAGREAYEADRSERLAGAVTRAEEQREAARARLASVAPANDGGAVKNPAEQTESSFTTDCAKGAGGIKRCTVGAND
jgi:hypothetical protein